MPFINVKTNAPIPFHKEESIKSVLGQSIKLLPGKSEGALMVAFDANAHLWFRGTNDLAAIVEVSAFGTCAKDAYNDLTGAICENLSAELGLKKERIFVKYTETPYWGWNGSNL